MTLEMASNDVVLWSNITASLKTNKPACDHVRVSTKYVLPTLTYHAWMFSLVLFLRQAESCGLVGGTSILDPKVMGSNTGRAIITFYI